MSEEDRNEPEGEKDVMNLQPGEEKGKGDLHPVGEEGRSHGRAKASGNLSQHVEEPKPNIMDRGTSGSNTGSQIATDVSSGQSQPVGKQSTGGKDRDQEFHSCDEDSTSASKSAPPNTRQDKTKHKKVPETFPDSLEGFGYYFNEDGRLTDMETGHGFVFDAVPYDHSFNQRRYEALGSVITEHVYGLLESKNDGNLRRVTVPINPKKNEPTTFFFMSEDAQSNPGKLLILIHGSGAVRAGQWARRLIINDSLDSGTQLPYIKEARKNGYGVIVMNTNDNSRNGERIRGSSYPDEHAQYIWDNFVEKSKAKRIDIVAHSAGGCVTVHLVKTYFKTFQKRVEKIAFTDSVHSLGGGYFSSPSKKVTDYMIQHAVNWVSSREKLGTTITRGHGDVQRVSAGTPKHEETSWYAFPDIFEWFLIENDADKFKEDGKKDDKKKKNDKKGGNKGNDSQKKGQDDGKNKGDGKKDDKQKKNDKKGGNKGNDSQKKGQDDGKNKGDGKKDDKQKKNGKKVQNKGKGSQKKAQDDGKAEEGTEATEESEKVDS